VSDVCANMMRTPGRRCSRSSQGDSLEERASVGDRRRLSTCLDTTQPMTLSALAGCQRASIISRLPQGRPLARSSMQALHGANLPDDDAATTYEGCESTDPNELGVRCTSLSKLGTLPHSEPINPLCANGYSYPPTKPWTPSSMPLRKEESVQVSASPLPPPPAGVQRGRSAHWDTDALQHGSPKRERTVKHPRRPRDRSSPPGSDNSSGSGNRAATTACGGGASARHISHRRRECGTGLSARSHTGGGGGGGGGGTTSRSHIGHVRLSGRSAVSEVQSLAASVRTAGPAQRYTLDTLRDLMATDDEGQLANGIGVVPDPDELADQLEWDVGVKDTLERVKAEQIREQIAMDTRHEAMLNKTRHEEARMRKKGELPRTSATERTTRVLMSLFRRASASDGGVGEEATVDQPAVPEQRRMSAVERRLGSVVNGGIGGAGGISTPGIFPGVPTRTETGPPHPATFNSEGRTHSRRSLFDGLADTAEMSRTRWYILPPYGWMLRTWNVATILIIVAIAALEPLRVSRIIAYGDIDRRTTESVALYCDLHMFMDMVLHFFSAYDDNLRDILVTSPYHITWRYAQSWLFLDAIVVFPFDRVVIAAHLYAAVHNERGPPTPPLPPSPPSPPSPLAPGLPTPPTSTVAAMEMLRLVKLVVVYRLINPRAPSLSLPGSSTVNPSVITLWKLFFIVIFVWHCTACFYWAIGTQRSDEWVLVSESGTNGDGNVGADGWSPPGIVRASNSSFVRYVYAMSWAVGVTTQTSRATPATIFQLLYGDTVTIIGFLMMSVIIGSATTSLSDLQAQTSDVALRLRHIDQYMRYKRLPRSICRRVVAFYRFQYTSMNRIDDADVLVGLPRALRMQMNLIMHKPIFVQLPLFWLCSEQEILLITQRLRPCVIMPGEMLIKENRLGVGLFLLMKGAVETIKAGDLQIVLLAVAAFGESALRGTPSSVSVRALRFCETTVLLREDFAVVEQINPIIRQWLDIYIMERDRKLDDPHTRRQSLQTKVAALRAARHEHWSDGWKKGSGFCDTGGASNAGSVRSRTSMSVNAAMSSGNVNGRCSFASIASSNGVRSVLSRYLRNRRQRRAVASAFSRHVPPPTRRIVPKSSIATHLGTKNNGGNANSSVACDRVRARFSEALVQAKKANNHERKLHPKMNMVEEGDEGDETVPVGTAPASLSEDGEEDEDGEGDSVEGFPFSGASLGNHHSFVAQTDVLQEEALVVEDEGVEEQQQQQQQQQERGEEGDNGDWHFAGMHMEEASSTATGRKCQTNGQDTSASCGTRTPALPPGVTPCNRMSMSEKLARCTRSTAGGCGFTGNTSKKTCARQELVHGSTVSNKRAIPRHLVPASAPEKSVGGASYSA
jgi:hypothetical protein